MTTSSSFTAGWELLPDDVGCAIGTCVAAMTQLRQVCTYNHSLPILKALAERTEVLTNLIVLLFDVNWVSVSVFCQCAHNTVLLVRSCVL